MRKIFNPKLECSSKSCISGRIFIGHKKFFPSHVRVKLTTEALEISQMLIIRFLFIFNFSG